MGAMAYLTHRVNMQLWLSLP